MGKVFVEEVMTATGVDRTDLVLVATHLVRTRQARSAVDALRRLEAGEFDSADLKEQMIKSNQVEIPQDSATVSESDIDEN